MANKTLHSLQFPGLSDTYVLPEEASEFSTSSTYAVGQYVTYRGILYKCITAVSHAGSWTGATNWSATDIGTELQSIDFNHYTKTEEDSLLATKQNTLTFDNFPTSGSANPVTSDGIFKSRVPMYGMGKNLLDNWYFVGGGSQLGDGIFPINQRGQTQYNSAGKKIDRWGFGSTGGTLQLQASGIQVTVTEANQSFSQDLSTSPFRLYGQTVTVSALTEGGDLYYQTGTLPSSSPSSTTTYISKPIPNAGSLSVFYAASTGRFYVGIANASGFSQSVVIAAMKLELGSEQTLAHQENGVWVLNEIPDYSEELRKCQRYFLAIERFISLPLAGVGIARNVGTAVMQFPTPVTMFKGVTPAVAYTGTFKLWHGSVTSYDSAPTVTGMSGVGLQSTAINFGVTVAGGLTSGEICMLQMSEDAKILISCEL